MSGMAMAAVAGAVGALVLVLFASGSVDVEHLAGVTADGLGSVVDGVVSLNPDMMVELTQQLAETTRAAQEYAEEAVEEAARKAAERDEEAAREATERDEATRMEKKLEAKEAMDLINDIRVRYGVPQIPFDERAYQLALARVNDINEYDYPIAHTNPYTGTCPDNMKSQYGFARYEYVAENLAGTTGFRLIYAEAIELWMDSSGHRTNLLWPTHYGGAVACDGGVCAFLGTNQDMYGAGCY